MSVDDAVTMMKPNYDNYCFSENKLADCMFNSDMVLYCMKSLILHGVKPKEIVDPNIRTDFNKLAYLVRLDHGLGENFSVIKEIAEQGEIVTEIVTHFSALEMTDVGNFKSLLFYFGLLSIKGVDMMGRPILHIPNLVVREQLFNFLIQGYARHDIFKLDVNRLRTLFENMSFKGDWKPMFEFLAEAIREQSRIREYIEGEAHIKGFLLAYLSMFRYYQLYPEYEMNKGFADFFFKPSPAAPVSPPYTYLLEVKYAKAGASEKEIRALADDAREQLIRYSKDECVVFFNSPKSFYHFIFLRFIDEVVQSLFKFFRSFSGSFNVCNSDTSIRIGKLLVILPYCFILFQFSDNIIREDKRG